MITKAQQLAAEMNKVLGPGTVRMGNDPSLQVTRLPTGVLPMDVLLDGGLPRNRYVEIYGDFSTLKSFVALRAIATTQASGGVCAVLDTEHAYDPEWAATLGVDVDSLIVQHPETGEEAVDATQAMVSAGADLVVWDSVAATLPKAEANKSASDSVQPARLAELMSRAMRRITATNSNTALLLINQTRMNIGMTFGPSESVPGGKAVPFYASYRIRLTKAGKDQEEVKVWDGSKMTTTRSVKAFKIRAHVDKSKLSAAHREAIFTFDLTHGEVDEVGYIISEGLTQGLITKNGAVWKMKNGKKSFRGEDALRTMFDQNPETLQRLRDSLTSPGSAEPAKRRVVRRKSKS